MFPFFPNTQASTHSRHPTNFPHLSLVFTWPGAPAKHDLEVSLGPTAPRRPTRGSLKTRQDKPPTPRTSSDIRFPCRGGGTGGGFLAGDYTTGRRPEKKRKTGPGGLPGPLCFQHGGSCGNTNFLATPIGPTFPGVTRPSRLHPSTA